MIEVENLTKTFKAFNRREGVRGSFVDLFHRRYREVHAVQNLSFSVPAGQMLGFIGPNGAGKSTTIKMLTGILSPSSGSLRVAGFVPFESREQYVRHIGVVFGQRTQLWWDIAVNESFRLLKRIYAVSDADYAARMETFHRVLELKPLLSRPVRKLSLGERMRCDLAASLLHNPKVVFLDEPTIGLDLIAKDEVRRFLKAINQQFQTTIILTTHDLTDIEELCERVIIIDHGQLVFDDSLDQLKNRLGGEVVIQAKLSAPLGERVISLNHPAISLQPTDLQTLELRFQRAQISNGEVIKRLFDQIEVVELKIKEPEIEEVVKSIYVESAGKGAKPGNRVQ